MGATRCAARSSRYPYLVLDTRYKKVREDGAIRSQAVLIAIGFDWEGRRNVLGSSWRTGKALRAGRTFLPRCATAVCMACKSLSAMIIPA